MLATLIELPSAWFMAALAAAWVAAWAWVFISHRRLFKFGPWAAVGLVAYVVSFLLNQSWHMAETLENQILIWQIALGLTGLMYGFIYLLLTTQPLEILLKMGVGWFGLISMVTMAAILSNEFDTVVWTKIWEIFQVVLIAAGTFACFWQTWIFFDRLVWAVLASDKFHRDRS